MSRRASMPSSVSSRGVPSKARPRKGGSVSMIMSAHTEACEPGAGARRRLGSHNLETLVMKSNHTGDTAALPSLRCVVKTAGEGRSRRLTNSGDTSSSIIRFCLRRVVVAPNLIADTRVQLPAEDSFRATASLIRALKATSSTLSLSWKSMARLVLPPRLELNRPAGSSSDAPLAKVNLTVVL